MYFFKEWWFLKFKLPAKFFAIYFSNISLSTGIGLFMMYILLSLWHTYSSALMASIPYLLMSAIPSFLSPVVGTLVDRSSKYKLGLLAISLSILSLFPLCFASSLLWVISVFSLLLFFESYFRVDYTISVRSVVGDVNLMYANNLWVISIGITYFIAYLLGAYLYAYLSFSVALLIVFAFYIIALILWAIAKVPEVSDVRDKKDVKYSEIFKVLKKRPSLLHLILIYDLVFTFVVITKTPAYIPYCFDMLKMSSFIYGAYSSLSALLFVIVPLIMHRFLEPKMADKYAVNSVVYEGILTMLIAIIPVLFSIYFYKISLFIILIVMSTFASTLEMDGFMTIFQKAVPRNIMGRFYSVRSLFRGAINVVSILAGGYLVDLLGSVAVIFLSGIVMLVIAFPTRKVLNSLSS